MAVRIILMMAAGIICNSDGGRNHSLREFGVQTTVIAATVRCGGPLPAVLR